MLVQLTSYASFKISDKDKSIHLIDICYKKTDSVLDFFKR